MTSWQPIETAPKDGTSVLLCDEYGMQVCVWSETSVHGFMDWVYGACDGEYNFRHAFDSPTHWMPLPDPPTPQNSHVP